MRWWPALLMIALVAGCGADDERSVVAATPSPVPERDFTFELPNSWSS
jgi:hypothetical protein